MSIAHVPGVAPAPPSDPVAAVNTNTRLETFCDGVFAIAMTLLVIDIKLPAAENLATTADVWLALRHLGPQIFAFLLSFAVILITWVNHDGALELVRGSSGAFIYANGFLMLTVVFIPFPTSLLGELLWTGNASPAVVLYNAILAIQALAWVLMGNSALAQQLTVDAAAAAKVRLNRDRGYIGIALYSVLAIAAFWIPLTVAIVTTASWLVWLAHGIALKRA